MAATAKIKFLRVPPRKVRAVADLVRGKKVDEAKGILMLIKKKGARHINDALNSAIANASSTGKVDVDNLFVEKIMVDGGPVIKRYTARAQGRGDKVTHKTSHITVVLGEK